MIPIKINYLPELEREYGKHRSGWNFVLKIFKQFDISENSVKFDSYVDKTFLWDKKRKGIVYYNDWIGIVHNPPGNYQNSLDDLLRNENFNKSLPKCRGLFTLSQYVKEYLMLQCPNLKTEVLIHPTEIPTVKFNFSKFCKNKNRKLIQIGFWLRNKESILKLKTPKVYEKCIMPFTARMKRELKHTQNVKGKVKYIPFLNANEYDEILSKNLVFLDLLSSSANNCIVECIVRHTPLLINKLPAVVEYLGENYPFYFETLEEANQKLNNSALIKETNQYLEKLQKDKFTADYFLESFIHSKIYMSLL